MSNQPSTADVLGVAYRPMSGPEIDRIYSFKEMGMEMVELMRATGSSRELEMAQHRLEEAIFWAVKHVALNGTPSR